MVKVLYILFFAIVLSAQELKIIEILDANLFLTEDSSLISLVNIDVPSMNDSDSVRRELAQNIIKYVKMQFGVYSIRFERSIDKCSDDDILKGHIFRIYPLSETNINAAYLEKGYAVYLPCDTSYMEFYTKSAKIGLDERRGLWKTNLVQPPIDYDSRFRVSLILFEELFEDDFVPIFGLNYRWSDLYTIVKANNFRLSLSSEIGSFVYFFLPYANIGGEIKLNNFYARTHLNYLQPIFTQSRKITLVGYDFGVQIPFGKRSGIELEINIKEIRNDILYYFTLNLPIY